MFIFTDWFLQHTNIFLEGGCSSVCAERGRGGWGNEQAAAIRISHAANVDWRKEGKKGRVGSYLKAQVGSSEIEACVHVRGLGR